MLFFAAHRQIRILRLQKNQMKPTAKIAEEKKNAARPPTARTHKRAHEHSGCLLGHSLQRGKNAKKKIEQFKLDSSATVDAIMCS